MRSFDAAVRESLEDFGSRIADIRKLCGLSQMDLAERVGIHVNTVANVERGEVDASILAVSVMLIELGCEGVMVGEEGFAPVFCESIRPARAFPGLPTNRAVMAAIIGNEIRQRRLGLDLSIEEISERAGIHKNTLWNLERGLVAPSFSTTYRIYRSLSVVGVVGSNDGISLL